MIPPTELTNQDHTLPMKVYTEMITGSDENRSYLTEQIWYKEPESVTPNLTSLLDLTQRLLNSHGYQCSRERWFVEIHRSMGKGEDQVVETPLAWHQDDGGGWPEDKVVTAIYYLKKDISLVGGNLLYSLGEQDPDGPLDTLPWLDTLLSLFQNRLVVNDDDQKNYPIVQVETGKTVLMRGDMWHRPENVQGIGERQLIVIQFPRLN